MPAGDNGTTHGVWFGPNDEGLPDTFKQTFKFRRDPFALSGEIRLAMRMHIAVQEALEEAGLANHPAFVGEDRNESRKAEANKREFVKEAIIREAIRREAVSNSRGEGPERRGQGQGQGQGQQDVPVDIDISQ